MPMRKTLLSYFIFLTTICFSQQFGFKLENDKTKVVIPIEVVNNMIVVPVVLNNQAPLKFILDTGVRTTVLTQKTYSDVLGLTYSKEIVISGPGGEKIVDTFVTDNVTLDLPGVHGEGHSMLVLEKDYLELRNYLGAEVHGIIGYELFSRFIVQMDYHKQRLILYSPESFKKKRGYHEVNITIEDTKPFIKAETKFINSTELPVKLLMDTGASHGLVLDPKSDERILIPDKNLKSIIGRGLGGIINGRIGRIEALEIGDYTIDNIIANFPDPDNYSDKFYNNQQLPTNNTAVPRNGVLGGEVLSRFSVIFNFPAEKIYLRKNSSYKNKFNYDMGGLTIKAKGARLRDYEITDLRDGSPGKLSGLRVGDMIVSINGESTASLDLNHVNGYFNSREGRRITMEVDRDGTRIKVEFRLVNQI